MKRLGIVLVVTGIVSMMVSPSFWVKAGTSLLDVKQVWYVNKSPFIVEGYAEPGTEIEVHGHGLRFNVGQEGVFILSFDVAQGVNMFAVTATKNGISETKPIMVEMDTTPPEVTLFIDGKAYQNERITIKTWDIGVLYITAFTEQNCLVKLENHLIYHKGNTFLILLEPEVAPSYNNYTLEVKDLFGNIRKTKIDLINIHKRISKLKAGSKIINTDDEDYTAKEPVQIIKGSTMVDIAAFPYSIIPESEINVAGNSFYLIAGTHVFTFTIGSNIAYFDGKQNRLDTPTKSVNNVALVPLRFICNNYGINIGYDSKTKEIILTKDVYPYGYKEGI